MSDLKNNLEEVRSEEFGFTSGGVTKLNDGKKAKLAVIEISYHNELKGEIKKLEQELQKTREQLSESNELLIDVKDIFQDKIFLLNINDSCFSRIRRWNGDSQKYIDKYFKSKDKQGE